MLPSELSPSETFHDLPTGFPKSVRHLVTHSRTVLFFHVCWILPPTSLHAATERFVISYHTSLAMTNSMDQVHFRAVETHNTAYPSHCRVPEYLSGAVHHPLCFNCSRNCAFHTPSSAHHRQIADRPWHNPRTYRLPFGVSICEFRSLVEAANLLCR